MATILNPAFPVPNRSKQSVKLSKDEDGVLDLGWCEGILSDGRPFRAETWAQDQCTMVTIFFSANGIEDLDEERLIGAMVGDGLVRYGETRRGIVCRNFTDDAGNALWSVNITVGVDDELWVTKVAPYFKYAGDGPAPNLFRW